MVFLVILAYIVIPSLKQKTKNKQKNLLFVSFFPWQKFDYDRKLINLS